MYMGKMLRNTKTILFLGQMPQRSSKKLFELRIIPFCATMYSCMCLIQLHPICGVGGGVDSLGRVLYHVQLRGIIVGLF